MGSALEVPQLFYKKGLSYFLDSPQLLAMNLNDSD